MIYYFKDTTIVFDYSIEELEKYNNENKNKCLS